MRRAAVLVALVLVPSLAACGDKSPSTPTAASIAGTWSLHTVNDTTLPYPMLHGPINKTEWLSDVLNLSAGGTFTEAAVYRYTIGSTVYSDTTPYSGTFTVAGSSVVFDFSGGETYTTTVSGNTLTWVVGVWRMSYRKQ